MSMARVIGMLIAAALASGARARTCEDAQPRDPLLGAPLVVEGQPVPDSRIQRELLLGPARAVLERTIDSWTIESELLQRAQERVRAEVGSGDDDAGNGYDAAFTRALEAERAAIEPGADALAAARERALGALAQGLDEPTEEALEAALLWRYGGAQELDLALVNELRFDATFLPTDPNTWPEVTLAAFQATPESARLQQLALRGWDAAEHARRSGREVQTTPVEDTGQRAVVRGALRPWMGVAIVDDPFGAVLATADVDGNGKPDLLAGIEALWPAARAHITSEDVALAKRWIATERVVRLRLREQGAALDVPDEVPAPNPNAPDGFCAETRARFHGLREAFVALHGAQALADEALVARARRAAGDARVHAELMLFATVDLPHRVWLDGEREPARERATEILARLRVIEDAWRARVPYQGAPANPGTLWRKELAANGDLEAPRLRGRSGVVPRMPRGLLGSHTHAQLLEALGEDARWRFVQDESLADRIFEIEPGLFGGPWNGRFGIALVRGTAFQEARQPPADVLMHTWILARAFERYAREARAAARIEGLD